MGIEGSLRVIIKETQEIHSVMDIDFMENKVGICSVPERMFRNGKLHTIYSVKKDFDDVILMFSTGVKDKNGEEILLGDLVEYFVDGLSRIKWVNGGFMVEHSETGQLEPLQYLYGDLEVVGHEQMTKRLR